jgi:hypothetical protein
MEGLDNDKTMDNTQDLKEYVVPSKATIDNVN